MGDSRRGASRRMGMVLAVALCAAARLAAQEAPVTPVAPGDSLRLRLEAPETVAAGDPVRLRLVVENVGDAVVPLYLTGRPVAVDVEVLDEDGGLVWRLLEGQVVSMVLQIRELDPGERLDFEAVWDQRTNAGRQVPPGVYRVRGLVPTDQRTPLATPYVTVVITEG